MVVFTEGEYGWHKAHAAGYNRYYHTYSASYCRSTGFPMFSSKNFMDAEKQGLYTRSYAVKKKVILDIVKVCGWYRVMHGYVPMYYMKPFEQLTEFEIVRSASAWSKYGYVDFLVQLLNCEAVVSVVSKVVDDLIQLAIQNQQYDCYMILINFKNSNDLYTNPFDKFLL